MGNRGWQWRREKSSVVTLPPFYAKIRAPDLIAWLSVDVGPGFVIVVVLPVTIVYPWVMPCWVPRTLAGEVSWTISPAMGASELWAVDANVSNLFTVPAFERGVEG
jgi:hypothetical protein